MHPCRPAAWSGRFVAAVVAIGVVCALWGLVRRHTGARLGLTTGERQELARRYVRSGRPPKQALEHFLRTAGPDEATAILDELTESYRQAEEPWAASSVAEVLLAREPRSPRRCFWQAHVFRAEVWASRLGQVGPEADRLAALVDAGGGEACRLLLHDLSRTAAHRAHAAAHAKGSKELREMAVERYRAFFARFADSPEAAEMHFYMADLLWRLERWDEAAEHYEAAVRLDPDGENARLAAHDAIGSRERALPAGRGHEPERWRRWQRAYDVYLSRPLSETDRVQTLRERARTYLEHGYLAEAFTAAREVMDRFPQHDGASDALALYFDVLDASGETLLACRDLRQFLSPHLAAVHGYAKYLLAIDERACRSGWSRR